MPHHGEPWGDDQELITHILRGSTAHWEMLYEAYFPRVYRFALKRLRDPVEAADVTQEVFFTVFNTLSSFRGSSSLLVWVFGITRNTVNRRFRQEVLPARRPFQPRGDLCETVIESQLTPLQRRIFHLKHLRRQAIRAIARTLGKLEDRLRDGIACYSPGWDRNVAVWLVTLAIIQVVLTILRPEQMP